MKYNWENPLLDSPSLELRTTRALLLVLLAQAAADTEPAAEEREPVDTAVEQERAVADIAAERAQAVERTAVGAVEQAWAADTVVVAAERGQVADKQVAEVERTQEPVVERG